jgi:hypothetical protein
MKYYVGLYVSLKGTSNCIVDERRKVVKIAVARRLAVIMHRMWTDGTEFRARRDGDVVPA